MLLLNPLLTILSVIKTNAIVTSSVKQRINEFLPLPSNTGADSHTFNLTQEPHLAGTPGNLAAAQYLVEKWGEYGITGVITPFTSLMTYPIDRAVELQGPTPFNATLQEAAIPARDPTSNNSNSVMTFAGFGPSGDVTAEVVYANYGLVQDFELLETLGVSVAGRIVIVKYGNSFRGTKAREASLRGAVGVLVYSDPADDGFAKGTVYPDGIWRPQTGVQRGSYQYIMICPGDPRRTQICLNDANANASGVLYSNIPITPLSWEDAQPILQSLGGPPVPTSPAGWQGALPFNYTLGPGPQVRLYVNNSWEVRTLQNVVATIPGTEAPDEYVIIGNHYDAWVFGAFDPISGTTTTLETLRGLGQLLQNGWKPKRTIIVCAWDGEEYGLIGSTQWAEANPDILKKTVAYLNVDVGVKGKTFSIQGTPSLSSFIREILTFVNDPDSQLPLSQVWSGNIGVLGSGSDYTAFIHHFGVPSIDMGFGGGDGVYHSIYDSYTWMKMVDTNFTYHQAMAQLLGSMTIALADLNVAPIYYADTANALQTYLATTRASLPDPSPIDLSALENAIYSFGENAWKVQGQLTSAVNANQSIENARGLNSQLYDTEKFFLTSEGLPSRFWFKHTLQAPGISTGYGSETFPGLTFAITNQNWTLAQAQVGVLADRINAASSNLQGPSESKSNAAVIGLSFAFGFVCLILILAFIRFRFNRRSDDVEMTSGGNRYKSMEPTQS